jgi:hypothetical protein
MCDTSHCSIIGLAEIRILADDPWVTFTWEGVTVVSIIGGGSGIAIRYMDEVA